MSKKVILQNRYVQVCATLIVADCLVFASIDPTRASAVWLITGYVLLGATMLAGAALLAQGLRSYGDRAYKVAWRLLRYSVIAAIVLIGLQSIGQLTTRDILTFTPFIAIAYWYFGYSKRPALALLSNK